MNLHEPADCAVASSKASAPPLAVKVNQAQDRGDGSTKLTTEVLRDMVRLAHLPYQHLDHRAHQREVSK